MLLYGCSSVGRALEWHSRGQRFDPAQLHTINTRYNPNHYSFIFVINIVQKFIFIFLFLFQIVSGQNDPNPLRFMNNPISDQVSIDLFELWDKKNSHEFNGIVFVGSSSIRKWHTSKYFTEFPIINRGFGGSQISDVNYFIKETVLKYNPKVVVLYAGDNDINYGKNPKNVLEDFIYFSEIIHSNLPKTKIIFISIKPSPSRWGLWNVMKQTNFLIHDYIKKKSYLYYVDTATPMLNLKGYPDRVFFVSDSLHLSEKGYDLWSKILEPILINTLDTK